MSVDLPAFGAPMMAILSVLWFVVRSVCKRRQFPTVRIRLVQSTPQAPRPSRVLLSSSTGTEQAAGCPAPAPEAPAAPTLVGQLAALEALQTLQTTSKPRPGHAIAMLSRRSHHQTLRVASRLPSQSPAAPRVFSAA